MTCQYIASAIANVPGGMLVDTVGRKGLLMAVSLFWVGFPYLLIGFTHSYLMLLVCVALVGFGNSLWHPTAIPTLAGATPSARGWCFRSTAWAATSAMPSRRWSSARRWRVSPGAKSSS